MGVEIRKKENKLEFICTWYEFLEIGTLRQVWYYAIPCWGAKSMQVQRRERFINIERKKEKKIGAYCTCMSFWKLGLEGNYGIVQ